MQQIFELTFIRIAVIQTEIQMYRYNEKYKNYRNVS